jgi:hypothetical protein
MRRPRVGPGDSGASCRRAATVLARANDAEAVTFGVGEDHVVGIRRTVRLNGPGRAKTEQTLDIASLILGIEIKVNSRPFLRPGGPHAQRQVRTGARARPQRRPVIIRRPTQLVIKRLGPKRELLLKVINPQDHGANAHPVTVAPAMSEGARASAASTTAADRGSDGRPLRLTGRCARRALLSWSGGLSGGGALVRVARKRHI